jgi:hypothetical protein
MEISSSTGLNQVLVVVPHKKVSKFVSVRLHNVFNLIFFAQLSKTLTFDKYFMCM